MTPLGNGTIAYFVLTKKFCFGYSVIIKSGFLYSVSFKFYFNHARGFILTTNRFVYDDLIQIGEPCVLLPIKYHIFRFKFVALSR